MTYEEADELIREHIDYGGSLDIHALAVAISSAAAGEPVMYAVTLTGAQLLEAFQYVAPDHPNDPDQLEHELTIQYGNGHSGKGMYCWFTDYPDEGSMLLDGATAAKLSTETVDKAVDRLTDSLQRLENACDKIAGLRTREQYLSMIDGGQQDALIELDNARFGARALLRAPDSATASDKEGA